MPRREAVTVQQARDEAAMLLGYAIYTALDEKHESPAHEAARCMIEHLVTPYLSQKQLTQSVATWASWTFKASAASSDRSASNPPLQGTGERMFGNVR